MEGLLTEEVIAVVLTALIVLAVLVMVIMTVVIIQILEEDFNGRHEKKGDK